MMQIFKTQFSILQSIFNVTLKHWFLNENWKLKIENWESL